MKVKIEKSTAEQQARKSVLSILNIEGVEEILDSPMLHISRQTITNILTTLELFKMIQEIQGSIVECGVYKADHLMTFFHLSNILEPFAFTRKIIGFDTFEGFASVSDRDPARVIGELSNTNFPK